MGGDAGPPNSSTNLPQTRPKKKSCRIYCTYRRTSATPKAASRPH
ncbi:jg14906, partial [Pararge aegeria aegeria]